MRSLYFSLMLIFTLSSCSKFSKTEVGVFLEEFEIRLEDDFDILENKSDSGLGDYHHTFVIQISEKDKNKIISEIKNSKNFRNKNLKTEQLLYNEKFNNSKTKIFQNYEREDSYVREYIHKPDEKYAEIYRIISIKKNENKLIFEDIDL